MCYCLGKELMPEKTVFLKSLLLAGIVSASLVPCVRDSCGQSGPGNPQTSIRPPDEDAPREILYPYYSLREGYESTLVMMDRAPRPIEFTMAIHGISGQTIWAKPRTIQPDERLELEIKKVLEELSADYRGDFSEGSVSLHFKGKGNPLGGRMIVEGPAESWNLAPVWRDDEFGQSMLPERLDTLWWELGGARDAEITIINTIGEPVSADLYLDVQGKRHAAPPLHFASHEMKRLSAAEVLAGMGLTTYQAPLGGLSIIPHASKAVLAAQGKLTDPETGRMTGLPFPLPQLQRTNALHATGVPISIPRLDSPFAGLGNFTPHVVVRNLLDSEQTVTLTVEYPGENSPQQTALAPVRLAGFTTQDIRLDSYYSALPLPLPFCAIRIQHNGAPGSLIAEVLTVEENSNEVEPIGATNEGNGYAGSLASYWGIDDETDFYVFFTNMGDKVCRVGFRVDAGGIQYHLQRFQLNPHESTYISLRELRDRQEPDIKGHTIPPNATEGRLFYIRLDLVPIMGRVVELPRRK